MENSPRYSCGWLDLAVLSLLPALRLLCDALAAFFPCLSQFYTGSDENSLGSVFFSSCGARVWQKKISFVLERDREIERLRVFWELRFGQIA
jgi:hypothetical protein